MIKKISYLIVLVVTGLLVQSTYTGTQPNQCATNCLGSQFATFYNKIGSCVDSCNLNGSLQELELCIGNCLRANSPVTLCATTVKDPDTQKSYPDCYSMDCQEYCIETGLGDIFLPPYGIAIPKGCTGSNPPANCYQLSALFPPEKICGFGGLGFARCTTPATEATTRAERRLR